MGNSTTARETSGAEQLATPRTSISSLFPSLGGWALSLVPSAQQLFTLLCWFRKKIKKSKTASLPPPSTYAI